MKYIFPQNDKVPFVTQAFTTIEAGNMSFSRDKNKDRVRERYLGITKEFDLDYTRMVNLCQVHGTDVFVAGKNYAKDEEEKLVFDAAITDQPGICLCTVHADCVPVYFADKKNRCIGLAHSGWKGTYGGISLNVLDKMNEYYGTRSEDVSVTIGPCICMVCFEVRDDVYSLFLEKYPQFGKYITRTNIDLAGIIKSSLAEYGVKEENISEYGLCTCCSKDLLYSHRRATKNDISDMGAMAAFTFMKGTL